MDSLFYLAREHLLKSARNKNFVYGLQKLRHIFLKFCMDRLGFSINNIPEFHAWIPGFHELFRFLFIGFLFNWIT